MNVKIGSLELRPGEKVTGEIHIPEVSLPLPATLIQGTEKGPSVLITAGIHSMEFPGIQTALELAEELQPVEICGSILILPVVNRSGFENRTVSTVHEDGKNLNRVFPGDLDGSTAEKIAHFFVHALYPQIDYKIDLHSGDVFEELNEFIYCQGKARPDVLRKSEEMARVTSLPFIVASQSDEGGAYNYAGRAGVPAVLIERGSTGTWSKADVLRNKNDVRQILRYLGSLDGEAVIDREKPIYREACYHDAAHTGLWYPTCSPDDTFEKGALLGVIKDYFGKVLEEIHADCDGRILYQTTSLNILENTPAVAYASLESEGRG